MTHLEHTVIEAAGSVADVIVIGDLNFNFESVNTTLHQLCDTVGLQYTIKTPTRTCPITMRKTLLDVILT